MIESPPQNVKIMGHTLWRSHFDMDASISMEILPARIAYCKKRKHLVDLSNFTYHNSIVKTRKQYAMTSLANFREVCVPA